MRKGNKIILIVLFFLNFSTLLLPWYSDYGIRDLNGTSIVSSNLAVFFIITVSYLCSVLFFEKRPTFLFSIGLTSITVYLIAVIFKIINWGNYALKCVGCYISITLLIINMIIYILAFARTRKRH